MTDLEVVAVLERLAELVERAEGLFYTAPIDHPVTMDTQLPTAPPPDCGRCGHSTCNGLCSACILCGA